MSRTEGKSSFLGGVTVLTVSTVAVKLIGLFYKIPLIKLVGMDGMAYFLAAYHIYTLLFTVSTSGLPVAVSILVARSLARGRDRDAERVERVSFVLFSLIGALLAFGLYLVSDTAAASVGIPDAAPCIRAISPALLFVASGSAVKGYFQGRQDMRPTAISQLIESAGKLVLGLAFTYAAIAYGLPTEKVAAFAIAGLTVGSFLSTAYLTVRRIAVAGSVSARSKTVSSYGETESLTVRNVIAELATVSAPITLGAAVMSVAGIIDTALVSKRLQAAGFAPAAANLMYSDYGNLAIPMFNLIPSFITPVALSMTPMLTEAAQRQDHRRERELLAGALRLCAIVAIPSSLGLAIFGDDILTLIFRTQTSAVAVAAPLLTALSLAVFFSCVITVTNAALQAYGKAHKPIVSTAVGVAVKIGTEFLLVGAPEINIFGAPISTLLCDLTIVLINLYFVEKYTSGLGKNGVFGVFGRPLFASAVSGTATVLFAGAVKRFIGGSPYAVLPIIAFNVIVYAVISLYTGAVSGEDIKLIPRCEKLGDVICNFEKRRKRYEKRRKDQVTEGEEKLLL